MDRAKYAVLRYKNSEMTVRRAAEIADLPVWQMERVLVSYGVQPRYGPEDPEELEEDRLKKP